MSKARIMAELLNNSGDIQSSYIPDSMGDITFSEVTLVDNSKLMIGASDDIQIYHDGSNSYISDLGQGDLFIKGSNINLQSATTGNNYITTSGNVGEVNIYHSNAVKLKTTSTGVNITGQLNVTSGVSVNGTPFATTTYVQDEIADLIGGAPGALDTLNELAAAINDDASYNTTLTTALATKQSKTADYDVGDNVKIKMGTGDDLQIYHDGLNSYIKEEGVGDLYIKGTNIHIQHVDSAPDEHMAQFVANGTAKLYYDGSKKIETTSTGVDVTGTITADGLDMEDNQKILLGASDDLQIYHDGGNSIIKDVGTGDLLINASDQIKFLNVAGTEYYLVLNEDGAVQLYHNGAEKLVTTSTGIDVTGNVTLSGTVDGRDVATDGTKLDSIESSADVTDTGNVSASGAFMKTGGQITGTAEFKGPINNTKSTGSVSGSVTINMNNYSYYEHTITGNTTYTVSNIPTGFTTFIIELTNAGSYTITWPTNTKWNAGITPTLTSGTGVDMIQFTTSNGGSTWRAITVMLDNR